MIRTLSCLIFCASLVFQFCDIGAGEVGSSKQNEQAESAKRQSETLIFLGSFSGEQFAAELRFHMTLTRNGSKLTGEYYYLKNPKRETLKLSGTIDESGKFKLIETDAQGKKTGEFEGEYTENDGFLSGIWRGYQSKKSFSFSARRQELPADPRIQILPREILEVNKEKIYSISMVYPEISGVKGAETFNQKIKELVEKEASMFRADMLSRDRESIKFMRETGLQNFYDLDYSISYADSELISVVLYSYVYSGGAHGNSFTETLNYDLTKQMKLNFTDIFIANSGYLEKISEICRKKLREELARRINGELIESDNELLIDGTKPTEDNYQSWALTKQGIVFYFDPYQVAPYALGSFEVMIPYEKLKDKINPRSPVARFLQ